MGELAYIYLCMVAWSPPLHLPDRLSPDLPMSSMQPYTKAPKHPKPQDLARAKSCISIIFIYTAEPVSSAGLVQRDGVVPQPSQNTGSGGQKVLGPCLRSLAPAASGPHEVCTQHQADLVPSEAGACAHQPKHGASLA